MFKKQLRQSCFFFWSYIAVFVRVRCVNHVGRTSERGAEPVWARTNRTSIREWVRANYDFRCRDTKSNRRFASGLTLLMGQQTPSLWPLNIKAGSHNLCYDYLLHSKNLRQNAEVFSGTLHIIYGFTSPCPRGWSRHRTDVLHWPLLR